MKVNAIRCKNCGDIIYSRSGHDFHWCSCEKCAIDGGFNYFRIIGNYDDWDMMKIEVLEDKSDEEARDILYNDWNLHNDKYGIIKNSKK